MHQGIDKERGIIGALGSFVLILTAILWLLPPGSTPAKNNTISKERQERQGIISITPTALDARAAFVWDVAKEKALYTYNEQVQLPLASLAKLATALTVSDVLGKDGTVVISPHAISAEGDSGLSVGERWKIQNLLDFSLLVSSNDGTAALAEAAQDKLKRGKNLNNTAAPFLALMNQKIYEIGLRQTYFINETGLDPSDQLSGAYGSARDIALLLSYIITSKPELLEATTYQDYAFSSEDKLHSAENTNEIAGEIPGLLASKTGFTDLAGGNLAIALDAGIQHPIVIVVMGSTFEGRFRDMQKLVSATLSALSKQTY